MTQSFVDRTGRGRLLLAPRRISQKTADMRHLLEQPQFRRFMLNVVNRSGIFSVAHGPDGRSVALADGRRELGLELLDWLEAASKGARLRILAEQPSIPLDQETDDDDAESD